MTYAVILAGGIGKRLQVGTKPKQYFKINKKPLLQYAVEKFLIPRYINYILIVANKENINDVKRIIKALIAKHPEYENKINYCLGGINRNHSISNAIIHLNNKYEIQDNDIVITHDGVRIFVDSSIIINNIKACKKYPSVSTIIDCVDTPAEVNENQIKKLLKRDVIKLQQTPQTFRGIIAKKVYIKDAEYFANDQTTDACGLFMQHKIKTHTVAGSTRNFKITTLADLEYAKYLLSKALKNDQ